MSVKRKAGIVIMGFYLLGQLVYVLSSIFRKSLTDFQLGFCEGFSLVAMVTGLVYVCWSFAHKRNPFKFE